MSASSRERFADLLDRHGATPERWPDASREAALELLREDPEARSAWEGALALEAALDTWTVPAPADDLALRIAAAAPERGALGDVRVLPALRLWQGALLAAVPVLIGFLIAVVQTDAPVTDARTANWHEAAELELGLLSRYGLVDGAPGERP